MKVYRSSPVWRRLIRAAASRLFDAVENNADSDIRRNGEQWFIRGLIQSHARSERVDPLIVLDVGANSGAYTSILLKEAAAAGCDIRVHAFEPSPAAAAEIRKLREVCSGPTERVKIIEAAVSDRNGTSLLYGGKPGDPQASLYRRDSVATVSISVPLIRLENYIEENKLTHIDFIKLDVEGSELAVLRGLGSNLDPERVSVIQFEYGGTTLDSGSTLRDIAGEITSQGYVLAKLLPHAIEVRPYAVWMEHFSYANYLALGPHWLAGVAGERW